MDEKIHSCVFLYKKRKGEYCYMKKTKKTRKNLGGIINKRVCTNKTTLCKLHKKEKH